MGEETELIPDLFRKEFAKMVAVISKLYGLQYIETAEDIVSETFLTATENWTKKGVPPNPTAWLYTVAKQKTLYHFRRKKIFDEKIVPQIKVSADTIVETKEMDFSTKNIKDSQLEMMFAICDPVIASEAQIALALRVLCGFGIEEIAEAFFSNKETINKRLFRAKEKLRAEKVQLEMPPENEIEARLDNVLHIIYLLFNEGYYSATQNQLLRKDFCMEALRLGLMLTEYSKTSLPKTNALVALMSFHASRLDARQNDKIDFILYDEQDENLWDQNLIEQGIHFLNLSAQGNKLSSYHLEAGIAFLNCQKDDTKEKRESILHHYNLLLGINYSPGVALNRLYALYKARGKEVALAEAAKINLPHNHFYFTLLGELYAGSNNEKAKAYFERALSLAKTETERQIISLKMKSLRV
jgi:RNA polymerase sigma-70 factor (ECF subfamily)